jgi:hypothetical protein
MKRYRLLTALVLGATAGLIAQTGREAYKQAFDVWQQTQASLERDSGTGGAAQVAQADRSAAAAESFEAARAAYLKSSAQDAEQRRRLLQSPATSLSLDLAPPSAQDLATRELQNVTRAIARFADDKDRGIQQLRQSLERERVALVALTETIQARRKTVTATLEATAALDQARTKTAQAFGDQASQYSRAVAQAEKEGAAWADYYQKLAQSILAANAPPPPGNVPTNVTTAAPRSVSVPGIPLARYVGSWTYPAVNGVFHGAQPESVELEVREQNGRVEGTLLGRFKPSPGNASSSALRFVFAGDLAATPTQRFKLMTSDGTSGTLELIPGPAFNLLEVNFLADPKANAIRSGNFILVKK